MQNEIDTARAIFQTTLNKFSCLKNYAEGQSLSFAQRRQFYSMIIAWINIHMREEDKMNIFQLLPHNELEITQLIDAEIQAIYPSLIHTLEKYNLLWYMFSNTRLLLEETAQRLNELLEDSQVEPSGEERLHLQQSLQQERLDFLNTSQAIIKPMVKTMDFASQQVWLRTYIETIERHYDYWHESAIFPVALETVNTIIDLQYVDLRHIDLSGMKLHHADLSYSRLVGCLLMGTGVSALQLSTAIGFSKALGLSDRIILEAQIIRYKDWCSRLIKRAQRLDELQTAILTIETMLSDESTHNLNYFDLALKRCELLSTYKGTLGEHTSGEELEKLLFTDLNQEQQSLLNSRLADLHKKEASVEASLDAAIHTARAALFGAYFKKIESLEKESLSAALGQLDDALILRASKKKDITSFIDLDNKLESTRAHLLHLELQAIEQLLLNPEKIAHSVLHHAYFTLAQPPQWTPPVELKERIKKIQKACIKKNIEFEVEQGNWQLAEEELAHFFSPEEITRRENIFQAEEYFDLEYGLRLQIIERLIWLEDLKTARHKMKELLIHAKAQKHTLDLRKSPLFANTTFWKGIPLQNIAIYLDAGQYQTLGLSQQRDYNEPLFIAIRNGNLSAVQYGVENLSWDANLSDEASRTPIISACWHGHLAIAKYLLENGGEIVKIERIGESLNPLEGLIGFKYKEDKERYKPIILWLIDNGLEIEPKHALVLNEEKLFDKSLAQFPPGPIRKTKMHDFLKTAVEEGAYTAVMWMLHNQKDCVASFPKVAAKVPFLLWLDGKPKELSLLHRACTKGQVQIVNALLLAGELDSPGSHANKQSALDYLTKLFFEHYPRPGSTPEAFEEFKLLYEKWKFIAEILCEQGAKHTFYTRLILSENVDGLSHYIKKVNISKPFDAEEDADNNTPLHIAVKTQNIQLVQYLIQQGAKLDLPNKKGETPLYLACELGNAPMVRILLGAKASPDGPRRKLTETEKERLNELGGIFAQIKELANKSPLLLPQNTPLRCAILGRHTAIIQMLCQSGANVEEKYDGKTALHWAVQTGNKESVAILLSHGAYIAERNNEGYTPFEIAAQINHEPIMTLLTTTDLNRSLICNERVKHKFANSLEQWAQNINPEKPVTPIEPIVHSSAPSTTILPSSSLSFFTPLREEPLGHTFTPYLEQHLPADGTIVLEPFATHSDEDEPLQPPERSEPISYTPTHSRGNFNA